MPRLFRKSYLLNLRNHIDEQSYMVPKRYLTAFQPTIFITSLFIISSILWLFLAEIPVTIKARGIVIPLGGVREVVSLGQGVIKSRPSLKQNKFVAGQPLLKLSDPLALSEYLDVREKYNAEEELFLKQLNAIEVSYQDQIKLNLESLKATKLNLERLENNYNSFKGAIRKFSNTEANYLLKQQESEQKIKDLFDSMLLGIEKLKEKGYASILTYIEFHKHQSNSLKTLTDTLINVSHASIEDEEWKQKLDSMLERISSISIEKQDLKNNLIKLQNDFEVEKQKLNMQMLSNKKELLDVERQLWMGQNIYAPYDGELIALKKSLGQIISPGEPVALINMEPQNRKMMLVVSPRAREGSISINYKNNIFNIEFTDNIDIFAQNFKKKINFIYPSAMVETNVFEDRVLVSVKGSALGSFENINLTATNLIDDYGMPVFAMMLIVGDEWQEQELSAIVVLPSKDAKRVYPGMNARLKPDFEKSLIGTQIKAKVVHVSNYLTTGIEAQSLIGSSEISQVLTRSQELGNTAILELERDSDKALQLTHSNLKFPLSAGTLATSYIEVEISSPIELLLPFYADLIN